MSPAPVMSQTCRGRAGKSRALARAIDPGHAVAVQRDDHRLHAEVQQLPGGVEAFLRRGDAHAQGPARLGPVRRDAGAAGVAAVVGVLDRIGQHAARPPRGPARPAAGTSRPCTRPCCSRSPARDRSRRCSGRCRPGAARRVGGDGGDALAIDAHHLVRIAVLGPAQEPLLDRRGAVVDREDQPAVDFQVVEQVARRCGLLRRRRRRRRGSSRRPAWPASRPRCRPRPAGAPAARSAGWEWGLRG